MPLTCQTPRLVITEATEGDVDGLLGVALSNPGFTGHHGGSVGDPDRFDRGMLERDLAEAWSHPLVLRLTAEQRRVIGWADVLAEHPRDLVPWIGLLERQALGFRPVDVRERVSPAGALRVTEHA